MAGFKEKLQQYEIHDLQGLEDMKAQVEGTGSYGTVYKVTVEGVPRAAKQLHQEFLKSDVPQDQQRPILEKFYQECMLLSRLHHPNIVEFIGVHFGKENTTGVISLVMEQMNTYLDTFLDRKNHPMIPISIKTSILLDVSYGLLYLHSMTPEAIVHRDLTVSNILLSKALRAKIADLGVSKLLDIGSRSAAVEHTKCPGNVNYMPPEALKQVPECTTALDIFSFGHLACALLCKSLFKLWIFRIVKLKY